MNNQLCLLKDIIFKYSNANKPYTLQELSSSVFWRNTFNSYQTNKKIINFINYWESKKIILKVSIEELIKNKVVNFKSQNKYMYILGSKGIELIKFLYPYVLVKNSFLYNLIILPFDEIYEKINKILCNSHSKKRYSKKTILNLLESTEIFKIGRYYYVEIAETKENIKKRLPYYPYVTYNCVKQKLLNNKLNRDLDLEIFKIFKDKKKIELDLFISLFKDIYLHLKEKSKIYKKYKEKKQNILNN